MPRRTRSWAGALLFATALLLLTFFLSRLLSPASAARPLLNNAGTAGAILFAIARFWLWRLAVGQRGAPLLLWSALLGLAGGLFLFAWLGPLLSRGDTGFAYIDLTLTLAALMLLSIGLLRARLVSIWVAAIGLTSGTLGLVRLVAAGQLGRVASLVPLGLEIVFLFAVAASLLARRPLAEAESAGGA